MVTINIEEKEYQKLKETEKKFYELLSSDKYVQYEYVCGSGWGCTSYHTYWLLSKDEATVSLGKKVKQILYSYYRMNWWQRLLHRPIDSSPHDRD